MSEALPLTGRPAFPIQGPANQPLGTPNHLRTRDRYHTFRRQSYSNKVLYLLTIGGGYSHRTAPSGRHEQSFGWREVTGQMLNRFNPEARPTACRWAPGGRPAGACSPRLVPGNPGGQLRAAAVGPTAPPPTGRASFCPYSTRRRLSVDINVSFAEVGALSSTRAKPGWGLL